MSTYGYARVSSLIQSETSELQEARLREYAFKKGLTFDACFVDIGESGSVRLRDRPGGSELCSLLSPGDHVLVTDLARAWRSMADAVSTFSDWQRDGITVHILNFPVDVSTPIGTLVFQILAAVAQFERALIRERITAGMHAEIAARGGRWGVHAPYGFRWSPREHDDPLEAIPEEQEVLRLAQSLRRASRSDRQIALWLNDRGFTRRDGGPWNKASVFRCLRKAPTGED